MTANSLLAAGVTNQAPSQSCSGGERHTLAGFWLARHRNRNWAICWYDKSARQTRRLSTGAGDFERAKEVLAEHVRWPSKSSQGVQ
jgi:hypothetical protein